MMHFRCTRLLALFSLAAFFLAVAGGFRSRADEKKTGSDPSFTPQQVAFFEKEVLPVLTKNCLKCHEGMPRFEAVQSHHAVKDLLGTSAMSCLNCHGRAHPTRAQRTPGSTDYGRLMEAVE